MTTDPIADLLTRIRNAAHARKPSVDVPWARQKEEIPKYAKSTTKGMVKTRRPPLPSSPQLRMADGTGITARTRKTNPIT